MLLVPDLRRPASVCLFQGQIGDISPPLGADRQIQNRIPITVPQTILLFANLISSDHGPEIQADIIFEQQITRRILSQLIGGISIFQHSVYAIFGYRQIFQVLGDLTGLTVPFLFNILGVLTIIRIVPWKIPDLIVIDRLNSVMAVLTQRRDFCCGLKRLRILRGISVDDVIFCMFQTFGGHAPEIVVDLSVRAATAFAPAIGQP